MGLTILTILIVIACILLVLIVLIQNPKGGGLGASFGGFSNQMMGVKRTTDILEKATWGLGIVLIVFSLATTFFVDTDPVMFERQPEIEGAAPMQQPQAPPVQDQILEMPDQTQPVE